MSSPISLELADHQAALLGAFGEVAENSLFAFADASSEAAFDEAARTTADAWLHAGIRFSGPVGGRLEMVAPATLIRRLCAAFAGAPSPDDIRECDLFDFAGELTNMVCGTWLTRTWQHESFSLTPPRVRRSPDHDGRAGRGGTPPGTFYLAIDDTPIRLELEWDDAVPAARERIDGR